MVTTVSQCRSLAEFLQQPETTPACEYIRGQVFQKPMPRGKHSRLQAKLLEHINQVGEAAQLAYGFPELRWTVGDRSLVPDIAVFRWGRIPLDEEGEFANDFSVAPDWSIEILSPNQQPNQVIGKILYGLESGTELAWLIDPGDRSVLMFQPREQPRLGIEDEPSIRLSGLDLNLTAAEIFNWLKLPTTP
ncbi:MAG: Uma2 family endonuclease [Phormidium sp.]